MSFSEPEQIVANLNIPRGAQVADIGAGTGFYSFAAAEVIGSNGKVFSLDVQKELLERLKSEASERGFTNITTVWVDAEKPNGTRLRDQSIDVVILANVLFQLEDKNGLVREVNRILKPSGMVLVVDWSESFGGMGPSAEQVFNESLARSLFEENGFTVYETIPAGEHHYGIIFKK